MPHWIEVLLGVLVGWSIAMSSVFHEEIFDVFDSLLRRTTDKRGD